MEKLTRDQKLEKKRVEGKKYYIKNKERINKKNNKYYHSHKKEAKKYYSKYSKEYWSKNHEKIKEYARNHQREIREKLIEIMGGKCVKCGINDHRVLQVDHINGGGYIERKNALTRNFNRRVIRSVENNEGKFQLLCANCNWIKRYENKECRRN